MGNVMLSGVCVNYQYVNQYTVPDQIPLPDVAEIIQKMGRAKFISVFDATKGYLFKPVFSFT